VARASLGKERAMGKRGVILVTMGRMFARCHMEGAGVIEGKE